MGRPPRARLGAAAALVLAPLAVVVLRCATSPAIPFVSRSAQPPWIMAPGPVSASLEQWGSDAVPVTRFVRRFRVGEPPARAELRVRALREFSLRVNGTEVARSPRSGSWRDEARVELAGLLRPGRNELEVDVSNAQGPALLALELAGLPEPVTTNGPGWQVSRDGVALGAALPADDTRANPLAYAGDAPLESLARRRAAVLALLTLGILGFLALERSAAAPAALPRVALGAASLAWLVLFVRSFSEIPLEVGFDARHHRAYVELLASRAAMPLATDGWSTFHPPLFYLLVLGLTRLGALLGTPEALAIWKLLPFASGLAAVFLVDATVRRLFPGAPALRGFAVLFVALLPMHLYSSAYFSNESFHTLLACAAVFATVDLLLAETWRPRRALVLGVVLGLAVLAKFTALLIAAVSLGFVTLALVTRERAGPARLARSLAPCMAALLVIAGWFYLRNWLHFGDPLLANWGNMPGAGHRWWQQPGFHTLAYFGGFGESLRHPYLSGFHSFWDSVYSTVWGDGFVGGRVSPLDRHPFWNYDFMSAGYLAALPATALIGWGAVRAVGVALTDPDPRRRLALGFLLTATWATGVAFVYLSLRLAFYSQAKGTYLLVVVTPLALFFALGAAACDRWLASHGGGWGRAGRAAFYAWLTAFAGMVFLAFAG